MPKNAIAKPKATRDVKGRKQEKQKELDSSDMAPKASRSKQKSGLEKMRDVESGSEETSEVKGRRQEKERALDAPDMRSKASGSKQKSGLTKKRDADSGSGEIFDKENSTTSNSIQSISQVTTKTHKAADIHHFFKSTKINGEEKRVCVVCLEQHGENQPKGVENYVYSIKTANNNLRSHLKKVHMDLYQKISDKEGWSFIAPKKPVVRTGDLRRARLPPFSPETFLEYLVRFITADDQSIRVVECPEFRDLCMLLRETLNDKEIPRRHKVREGILNQFRREFHKLRLDLKASAGKISLTADVWSNQRLFSFLAVTAHWIAIDVSNLKLRAALIGFKRIKGHSGSKLAKAIYGIVRRAGIEKKIGHITLDNASNNDTMMECLQKMFEKIGIDFKEKDNRIRCYPHIINICVSHIVKSLGKDADRAKMDVFEEDDDEEWETDDEGYEGESDSDDDADEDKEIISGYEHEEELATWFEAVKKNPVKRVRDIVRHVRSSGERSTQFQHTIQSGNQMRRFKDEEGKVIAIRELQLVRDVKHRWDSLYNMLDRVKELQPAIEVFARVDLPPLMALTEAEWDVLDGLRAVLEVPHEVQQVMSAHTTPILSGAVPSFELFMTKWEQLGDDHMNLKPWIDIGLKWAKKYYTKMDDTRAYVIAMFINPCIRFTWIEAEWDKKYNQKAKEAILKLMKEYDGHETGSVATQAPASPVKKAPTYTRLPSKYNLPKHQIYKEPTMVKRSAEEEFHRYKSGPVSPDYTDLIEYWAAQKQEYPRLYALAMDYLPIQASAVPCEQIFSSAGETDTKRRNRINPELMEALQILKFIYKKERLNFTESLQAIPEPIAEEGNVFLDDVLGEDNKQRQEAVDNLLRAFSVSDSDNEE